MMSVAASALLALCQLWPVTLAFGVPRPAALWRTRVDAGTFAVTIAGKRAGQEIFEIIDVGLGSSLDVRTRSTLALPSGAVTTKTQLWTDAAFRPRGGIVEITTRGQTSRITLQARGDSVETITTVPGRRNAVSTTQPPRMPDLYFGANVLAHLTPLCREAGAQERTLTAFPAAPLKISALVTRRYPLTKLGAPTLELRDVVADVARSIRIEVLCDGTKLVAVHQYNQRLTAVRSSYEELASMFDGVVHGKPILPATLVELPRKVRTGDRTATLGCTLLVPRTHSDVMRIGQGRELARSKAEADAFVHDPNSAPDRPRPLPAVVLLGGFGAQDREGNSVGPGDFHLSFFSTLALTLGEAGVASLRCDDRGTGQSTGDRKAARLETLMGDALAELRALAAEPAIDPARLGLIGHSEGALVASMLARRNNQVRALALLAPPGRPVDTIILDQEEASMKRFGRTDREISVAMTELRGTYDAVRAGTPPPAWLAQSERRAFVESSPWLRSLFRHDPLADALQLSGVAVFIGQGAKDVQITVKDAELMRDAFVKAGNRSVTTKIYPALNHLFAASKNDSLADYYDPQAQIDAGFLQDVAAFLSKSLARSNVASR